MADDDSSKTISLIYLIGHIIGALILVPVLLVYVILYGKRSCYGWSVMAMMVSYIVWYVTFAVVMGILSPCMESPETSNLDLCTLMLAFFRVVVQFFYISSYCWTLMLGYHLWKMLRTLSSKLPESQGLRQFLFYCAFAFGLPLCVTAVSLAVLSSINSKHGFGWDVAHTMRHYRYLFFYLPVGIVFLASIALMYSTLKWLREVQKNRESLGGKPGAGSSYTDGVLVCKLMVLMGAMLAFDVAFNVLDTLGLQSSSVQLASFEAVRTILHAGSLFWILVWNKEIREKMVAMFPSYFRPLENEQPLASR